MSNLSDEQLVVESRKGKLTFFEELVRRYQDKIYFYVLKRVVDGQIAADIVQETFVGVYENLDKFDEKQKFKPWLYRIAQNKCHDHWRKSKVEELSETVADERENVMDKIMVKETVIEVRNALVKLPEKYRGILHHYYFEELSYEELSKKWKLPINTVRTRLKRGKENLFKIISDARKGRSN